MSKEPNPKIIYGDIICLPHHQSADRKHMSLYDRAAQFAPFAALVGYDEMVAEEGRLTDEQRELSEYGLEILNRKLDFLSGLTAAKEKPEITVTYFVPDERKSGGSYMEYTGRVKRIDDIEGVITFYAENEISNGMQIPLDCVSGIYGEVFKGMED